MTLEDEQSDRQAEWEAACTERLGAGVSCVGQVAVSARVHAWPQSRLPSSPVTGSLITVSSS